MKTTPQNTHPHKTHSSDSGAIGTGLLIALAVVAALLFLGSYLLFSKKAPPAANLESKPTELTATAEKPQAQPAQKRTPPPNTPAQKIRLFADIDLDGDGVMTREEYEAAHWKNFERCDKNKDSLLERSEFPWGAILAHDKNKDTKLDRDEYKLRYYEGFRDTDKNTDGVIFVEET